MFCVFTYFRFLRALKTDFVAVAAGQIAAPAAGERHRGGHGAMAKGDAEDLVGEAVAEAAGELAPLVQRLWQEATSQVAGQCKAILQVCAFVLLVVEVLFFCFFFFLRQMGKVKFKLTTLFCIFIHDACYDRGAPLSFRRSLTFRARDLSQEHILEKTKTAAG